MKKIFLAFVLVIIAGIVVEAVSFLQNNGPGAGLSLVFWFGAGTAIAFAMWRCELRPEMLRARHGYHPRTR